MSINKIMRFKQFLENKSVRYSAVVLDSASHDALIQFPEINSLLTQDHEIIAHHMTIKMGNITGTPYAQRLGKAERLFATHVGSLGEGAVVAVKVDGLSDNQTPHVTVAVDRSKGGKPFMSNQIKNWTPLSKPLSLYGTVQEIM